MESVTGRTSILIEANEKSPVPLRYYFATRRDFAPLFMDEEAGPGAPHGLLGLRGDGIIMSPKKLKKKKKGGFDKEISGVNSNEMPRGLDLNPSLQSAAERTISSIDRRIQRIVQRETYDNADGYGGGAISKREQRKMKENMLKAELRKSVPSIITLLRRLQKKELLPAIFFIFSRKGCDNAAEILCDTLKADAEEKAYGSRRRTVREKREKNRKGKLMKGKGRGRGRRHSNNNDWDLNEDELAILQDNDGRNFRAELLDQLLSDDFESRDFDVEIEDDSLFSEKNIQFCSEVGLLNIDETREVALRLSTFNLENPEIAFEDKIVEQLLSGIGSHHAGILPAHKAFVETLFRLELMRVIFATETLAAGINMPARTTVICSMAKRGDLGMELLETHNLLQMAGRAGRRGMDIEGACVIASTPFETADDAITILTKEIKPISSQFAPSYALAVNLIERGDGKLDVARSMVQKSFAVFENKQKEIEMQAAMDAIDLEVLMPEETFLNALQLALEKELIRTRDGTSPTGKSHLKESKLASLVDVLADGKKLKKVSKRYSGSAQMLDLEQSTLKYLERELREMESLDDSDLPSDIDDKDVSELMSEIKRQRQRVAKGEREVNGSLVSAMAKVANKRMEGEDEESESLRSLLYSARFHEDSTYPKGAPLEPGELNRYIKTAPKNNRRSLLAQTTSLPSADDNDESWSNMLAVIQVLEAYGCLIPSFNPEDQYRVTDGGEHVGSLGMDNSLWQLCALGGAWDIAYESKELDSFQDALADFEDDQEGVDDVESDIPNPQSEAETLTKCLCDLSASEMAGYVSSLVIDSPRNAGSTLESFQKLSYNQQRVVQGSLLALERLVEVQRRLGVDDAIGKCQLELSACDVVTEWANGCSWNDALAISGAAPGDLVRTLSRALDALRQLGNLPYIPARALDGAVLEARGLHPRIRSLCREAAREMDRYPVKDMLPFEEVEDEVESDDEVESGDDEANEEERDDIESDVGAAVG